MNHKKNGFSLIEVLVFITILSLFFVAAITVTIFSLQSMKVSQHKIIATRLAEEGVEWLKSEKEDDWNTFILRDISSGSGTTYCLNTTDWETVSSCGESTFGNPSIFKRELVITNQSGTPTTQVDATLTVSWEENRQTYEVPIKSVFQIIE